MTNLTDEQLANDLNNFLTCNVDIRRRIENFTEADADALGITLEQLRESETMRELRLVADANDIDSTELFWSYIFDTPEELAVMIQHREHAIKKSLGG